MNLFQMIKNIKGMVIQYFEPVFIILDIYKQITNSCGYKLNYHINNLFKNHKGALNILIVRDTSASMQINSLENISKEFKKINRRNIIYGIVDVDMELVGPVLWNVSPDSILNKQKRGRGGTSFAPIFDLYKNADPTKTIIPNLIIYLTDLYGHFPTYIPESKVVWICDKYHKNTIPPFGYCIYLEPITKGTRYL